MLTDGYSSLRMYLNERVVSPLLGALVVSWSIWNYKFILLIFSSLKYQDKLRMISILYSDLIEIYGTGLLYPLLTSLFYLFIFPYPSKYVYSHALAHQQKLNVIKQEKENQKLLSLERSLEIRAELESLKRNHASSVEDLIEKVKSYEQQIITLTETNSSLKAELEFLKTPKVVRQHESHTNFESDENYNDKQLSEDDPYKDTLAFLLSLFFDNNNKDISHESLVKLIVNNSNVKEFIAKRYIERMVSEKYLVKMGGYSNTSYNLSAKSIDLVEHNLL